MSELKCKALGLVMSVTQTEKINHANNELADLEMLSLTYERHGNSTIVACSAVEMKKNSGYNIGIIKVQNTKHGKETLNMINIENSVDVIVVHGMAWNTVLMPSSSIHPGTWVSLIARVCHCNHNLPAKQEEVAAHDSHYLLLGCIKGQYTVVSFFCCVSICTHNFILQSPNILTHI